MRTTLITMSVASTAAVLLANAVAMDVWRVLQLSLPAVTQIVDALRYGIAAFLLTLPLVTVVTWPHGVKVDQAVMAIQGCVLGDVIAVLLLPLVTIIEGLPADGAVPWNFAPLRWHPVESAVSLAALLLLHANAIYQLGRCWRSFPRTIA